MVAAALKPSTLGVVWMLFQDGVPSTPLHTCLAAVPVRCNGSKTMHSALQAASFQRRRISKFAGSGSAAELISRRPCAVMAILTTRALHRAPATAAEADLFHRASRLASPGAPGTCRPPCRSSSASGSRRHVFQCRPGFGSDGLRTLRLFERQGGISSPSSARCPGIEGRVMGVGKRQGGRGVRTLGVSHTRLSLATSDINRWGRFGVASLPWPLPNSCPHTLLPRALARKW